jgi:hypothetical protein
MIIGEKRAITFSNHSFLHLLKSKGYRLSRFRRGDRCPLTMNTLHSRADPASDGVGSYEDSIAGGYGTRIDYPVHNHSCVWNTPDLGHRILQQTA